MKYYTGWHQINAGESGTKHFENCLISANRLLNRKSNFPIQNWILDNGGFSRFLTHGKHLELTTYSELIDKWANHGNLNAAVSQDWLCTPPIMKITGLSIADHHRLSIERYDQLLQLINSVYLMPVLQGQAPSDYVDHLLQYGDRLNRNQWVGVGSIAQLNSKYTAAILIAIKSIRKDLRLHGFGVKQKALNNAIVWDLLYSADSQAHGLSGGSGSNKYLNSNNPLAAVEYSSNIKRPSQLSIFATVEKIT